MKTKELANRWREEWGKTKPPYAELKVAIGKAFKLEILDRIRLRRLGHIEKGRVAYAFRTELWAWGKTLVALLAIPEIPREQFDRVADEVIAEHNRTTIAPRPAKKMTRVDKMRDVKEMINHAHDTAQYTEVVPITLGDVLG